MAPAAKLALKQSTYEIRLMYFCKKGLQEKLPETFGKTVLSMVLIIV